VVVQVEVGAFYGVNECAAASRPSKALRPLLNTPANDCEDVLINDDTTGQTGVVKT
jgi:hypothetical protein